MMQRVAALVIGVALISPGASAGVGAGFGGSDCRLNGAAAPGSSGRVLIVDKTDATKYQSIGAAVGAAAEGDTIIVKPGIYKEYVSVTTPGLRITGTDRNAVIMDGESARVYGLRISADRVLVENMTGHNYTNTAFFWTHQTGFWGRYLTAYNNGRYGIYSLDSRCGQFDRSHASGNADSGFYIGECFPCDAVIEHIEAANNSLGYSGTNAGGNLVLRDSWWHDNGLAIVPNTLNGEARPPQRGTSIENNLIENNNNATAPGVNDIAGRYFGGGIVIAGGIGNEVFRNTIKGHQIAGIVLAPIVDTPGDGGTFPVYVSEANTVQMNTVTGPAGSYDLAQGAASGPGNCWSLNTFTTSAPPLIQDIWTCQQPLAPPGGDPYVEIQLLLGFAGLNGRAPQPWETYTPTPGPQTVMADDGGDGDYTNDGAPDAWLPALGLSEA